MKSGIKTLAMWLILGIIFVMLISSILDNSDTKMTYSDLMIAIQDGKVDKITISANGTKGHVTIKNTTTEKEVNIPSLDSFIDKTNDYVIAKSFTLEKNQNL